MNPLILYVGDNPTTLTLAALSRAKAPVQPLNPPAYTLDKTGVVDLHVSADGMAAILDPIAPGIVTLDITDEGKPNDPNAKPPSSGVTTAAPVARPHHHHLAPEMPADVKGDTQREAAWTADQEAQALKSGETKPLATGAAHTKYVIEVRAADAHSLHVDVGQPDPANRAEVERIKRAIKPVPERKVEPAPVSTAVHTDPAPSTAVHTPDAKTA